MDIIERFLKYVSYETTSNEESETVPSSDKEIALLKELVKDMEALGLKAKYPERAHHQLRGDEQPVLRGIRQTDE